MNKLRKDPRTREQLIAEVDRLRQGYIGQEIGSTIRTAVMAGCVGFVAWCGKEVVASLAGMDTNAHIVVNVLSRLEVAAALSLGVGAAGVMYGLAQRKLRRDTVQRLQSRIQVFERRADPARSSSLLMPDGTTNPEDL